MLGAAAPLFGYSNFYGWVRRQGNPPGTGSFARLLCTPAAQSGAKLALTLSASVTPQPTCPQTYHS